MFDLTGKVALVTGASSGIGRASALALSAQGAKVVVAARRLDKLTALAAEIKSHGKEALAVQMDVLKKADIDSAVAETVKTFGRLDILLNNAGVGALSPALEMTEETWDQVLNTNLRAYFLVAQAAAKEMVKNNPPTGGGRIINIASILSGGVGSGMAGAVNYCASKGGVVAMTEALADEFAMKGITVNAIGPGFIETDMTRTLPEKVREGFISNIPLGRMGTPEDIAEAVFFLATDASNYITGQVINVNGGLYM